VVGSDSPSRFRTGETEEVERPHTDIEAAKSFNGAKESISTQGLTPSDVEVVQLLREMRQDLAKLTKISAKASRRNKAQLDYLEKTKLSRRWGLALLIVIAVLMVIQILQMAGYGPGSSNGDDNNTQTLQRIRTHSQTLERIHTAG
jgi:hypothetical protein